MKHILVYTSAYRPDQVDRNLPLVHELRQRGYRVTCALSGPRTSDIGHPDWVASDERFAQVGTRVAHNHWDRLRLVAGADVVVTGVPALGDKRIARMAQAFGVPSIQYDDWQHLTPTYFGADWMCVTGEAYAQSLMQMKAIAADNVVITGSTQADYAQRPEVKRATKRDFCRKYGLDPGKRMAVWLPDSAPKHDDWMRRKYVQVCETVRDSPNHSLVIKPHPNESSRVESGLVRRGAAPHQALTPWATVIEPEDAYICYNVCDVGISTQSSVGLEFPLFRKPFIYVDADKSPVLAQYRKAGWWERDIGRDGRVVPSLVGTYCAAEELGDILANARYEVMDQARYEEHVTRFFYKNDGLAYQRIADVVERVARETPGRNGVAPLRWARAGAWLSRAVAKRGLSRLRGKRR